MLDYENLDNIEACGECGTFHDASYCPAMFTWEDMEKPFCEQHPDVPPKMVRGVEGDDIGYECPSCNLPGIHEYIKQAKLIDKAYRRGIIDVHQQEAKMKAEWKHCTGLTEDQQFVELCTIHKDTNFTIGDDWSWRCHWCCTDRPFRDDYRDLDGFPF